MMSAEATDFTAATFAREGYVKVTNLIQPDEVGRLLRLYDRNFECIQPYAFPVRIFGDRGTIRDHRLYAPAQPGHQGWANIPGIRPDSSAVSHHPFQAQADHFIDCLRRGVESHCNLADAVKTHEVVFAALECYRTGQPVKLPLA